MDQILAETVNVDRLAQALAEAPRQAYLFLDDETHRFGNRFRKAFITLHLSGRPGLQWGAGAGGIRAMTKSIGKNVRAFGAGTSLDDYRAVTKISRLLATHERGDTIPTSVIRLQPGLPYDPSNIPGLFALPGRGVLGIIEDGHFKALYLFKKAVTEPARLGFREMAATELRVELIPRWEQAMLRAMRKAMDDRLQAVTGALTGGAHA